MPITFDRRDQWVHLPRPGAYPLVVCPVVSQVCLAKVLVDGGSALDIIFASTLQSMGYDMASLVPSDQGFYSIIPGAGSTPVGRATLPVTFGTRDNYRTEYVNFEVAEFEASYHAILGRSSLTKFMAIPNHTYLLLKMPAPKGVLSVKGTCRPPTRVRPRTSSCPTPWNDPGTRFLLPRKQRTSRWTSKLSPPRSRLPSRNSLWPWQPRPSSSGMMNRTRPP